MPRAAVDAAALLYGRTTGRAKGVLLSHENLVCREGGARRRPSGLRSCAGSSRCPSHAYGLLVTVVGFHAEEQHPSVCSCAGSTRLCAELMREHRTQITAVVPSMLQLLLAQPVEDYDLSELRYVVRAVPPLPTDVAEEFLRRVPQVEIREGYGLTETAALVVDAARRAFRRWVACSRREVRIDGDDEVGEICVRSRGVMLGYWQAPELTSEAIQGGWLYTGDLGTSTRTGISMSSIGRRI